MVIRQVNLAAYPQVIQVEAGDIIRVITEFDYVGPALSGTIYTALWNWTLIDLHNEIAHGTKSFNISDSPEPGNHITGYVDITFPHGYSEGLHYGLYTKIMGVLGEPRTEYYEKIIELVEVAPPEYTLTLTLNPPIGGYVTLSPEPAPPGYSYPSGTRVTLTAHPYPDYEFDHWSGDVYGTSLTASVLMSSDMTVVANFREIAPSIELQPGGNTVKWTGGPTYVSAALSKIIDYVTLFLVLRADGVWIQITGDVWDSWAIPKNQICGIYVDRACMVTGFVWA